MSVIYHSLKKIEGGDGYIAASSNGAVRIDGEKSNSKILGLCTYNLKVCIGVIISHQASGKSSLTHLKTMRTDIQKAIGNELVWFQQAPVSELRVTVVQNTKFLDNNNNHRFNVQNDLFDLMQVFHNHGIPRDNINTLTTDSGVVMFRREDCAVFVPDQPSSLIEASCFGMVCPYPVLRETLNSLPSIERTNIDLQFDGVHWTKIETAENYGVFSEAKLSSFAAYRDNKPKLVELLGNDPCLLEIRNVPDDFRHEFEWLPWLDHIADQVIRYVDCKREYDASIFSYKMFSINVEQRELINSLGGWVEEARDRDLVVVRMPSQYLVESVRSILKMDRLRIKSELNQDRQRRLSEAIKGWRGETEQGRHNSVLLTFPFIDENDKKRKRNALSSIFN